MVHNKQEAGFKIKMSKEEIISDLRERSKNDKEIIVGSEIRILCDIADEYRTELEKLSEKYYALHQTRE